MAFGYSFMHLKKLSAILKGTLVGDGTRTILGVSSPSHGQKDTVCVANSPAYLEQALRSETSAIVIDSASQTPLNIPVIVVENCQLALITLLELFAIKAIRIAGTHPSACIGENSQVHASAQIGPNVVIGEHCTIGENVLIKANTVLGDHVTVGENSTLHANVNLYDKTMLGKNVIIHAGCVIGADGFGYHFNGEEHLKLHHLGNVDIGDNVEIGANTTIDRATLGTTCIGDGTKIDNLVQIAHNVTLGKHNILCAFSGVAGSVTAGDNVIFAANAGAGDHVVIADNVTLGPRTGIASRKRLASGTTWLGNPGRPAEKAIEQIVSMQRLPGMKKQIKRLQEKVKQLEAFVTDQK